MWMERCTSSIPIIDTALSITVTSPDNSQLTPCVYFTMNDNVYCKQDVECIMLRVVTLVHNVTLFIKIILCECYRRQRMGRTNIKHVYTRCEPQAQVLQPSAGQLPKPRNRPYFEPPIIILPSLVGSTGKCTVAMVFFCRYTIVCTLPRVVRGL